MAPTSDLGIFRIQAFSLPIFGGKDFFIRHSNFEAELMRLDSPGFPDDFRFRQLSFDNLDADGHRQVTFESVNAPGFFLRHKNFRLVLEKDDNSQQFANDSNFKKLAGFKNPEGQGFKSFGAANPNLPNQFIRHREFHIFLETRAVNPKTFDADSSFKLVPA